jgi:hypothetical protein
MFVFAMFVFVRVFTDLRKQNYYLIMSYIEALWLFLELDSKSIRVHVRICHSNVRTKCSRLMFVFALFVYERIITSTAREVKKKLIGFYLVY